MVGDRTAPHRNAAVREAARLLGDLARFDEPIGARTTYKVGGRAALFAEVSCTEDLETVAVALDATALPLLVLGRGSNLLVADAGFDGLCLVLGDAFATISLDERASVVESGAAAPFPSVARRSAAAGLRGLEWAVGVPGSVGGAVAMNAGGHGAETAASLLDAELFDLREKSVHRRKVGELGFGYRHSNLGPFDLVLGARFRVEPGDARAAASELAAIVAWRRAHQPGGRNAGSVFQNPAGDSAGRLVDEAGLKGYRVGSAQVSPKHANFIQSDAGGSADDVYRLIDQVRTLVARRCGVTLIPELRMAGFKVTSDLRLESMKEDAGD